MKYVILFECKECKEGMHVLSFVKLGSVLVICFCDKT